MRSGNGSSSYHLLLLHIWTELSVLKHVEIYKEDMKTKSSIMLGLGETDEELKEAMIDLSAIGVDILTQPAHMQ